jgi:hypothetical protein
MKTELVFADKCLEFIRNYDIPSALQRVNKKSDMSHCIKDIHRDLIISDQ